jgi:myo-inositol-1-phosphate synthase
MRAGLAPRVACVADTPDLAVAKLPGLEDLVFGGHDVVTTPLVKRAEMLAASGVVPAHVPALLADELAQTEERLRPGGPMGHEDQRAHVLRLAGDIEEFRASTGVDRVVVISVASVEAPLNESPAHAGIDALDAALEAGESPLSVGSLYAYAAFHAGAAFVDFTPSSGARIPALEEMAQRKGLPFAGSDGKTGETLVKSALAPMFVSRDLHIQSWVGMNILGGGDGATLADPHAQLSKTRSKGRSLSETLGYDVDAPVHIDYVPDMGEWKTAWDHISFEGFLGIKMTMQFTWQGCDSTLAAPLVLDLVRLTARALEVGESGPLANLGFYFKDPVGTGDHRLGAQYDRLCAWAVELGQAARP